MTENNNTFIDISITPFVHKCSEIRLRSQLVKRNSTHRVTESENYCVKWL